MMDLLNSKKYRFFVKHLDTIGIAPLPKRNSSQALRISFLHQRAWLLKLLTVELHIADMTSSIHREACQSILSQLFGDGIFEHDADLGVSSPTHQNVPEINGARMISKTKVPELLEVVQLKSPDPVLKSFQAISSVKYGSLVWMTFNYYSGRLSSAVHGNGSENVCTGKCGFCSLLVFLSWFRFIMIDTIKLGAALVPFAFIFWTSVRDLK